MATYILCLSIHDAAGAPAARSIAVYNMRGGALVAIGTSDAEGLAMIPVPYNRAYKVVLHGQSTEPPLIFQNVYPVEQ